MCMAWPSAASVASSAASESVGWAWIVWMMSSSVASSVRPTANSWIISVASEPTMWAPSSSPDPLSAAPLRNPPASPPPPRHEDLLRLERLRLALNVHVHRHSTGSRGHRLHADPGAEGDASTGEEAGDLGRDLLILDGENARERLQPGDLHALGRADVGELH